MTVMLHREKTSVKNQEVAHPLPCYEQRTRCPSEFGFCEMMVGAGLRYLYYCSTSLHPLERENHQNAMLNVDIGHIPDGRPL